MSCQARLLCRIYATNLRVGIVFIYTVTQWTTKFLLLLWSIVFSPPQLEVLHLLSPAQKAELLLKPEVASLDNGTLTLIFHNLLTGGSGPHPTASPGGGHSWTTPGYPLTYHPQPTYNPYLPSSPHNTLREVL